MGVENPTLADIKLFLDDGRFADADAACWDLIIQDSLNAGLWRMRGLISLRAKDYQLASVYFTRALMMTPDVTTTEMLAEALFAQENVTAAREALASLAPHYRDQLTQVGDNIAALASQALAAAICANDTLLTRDLLAALYPWSRKLLSQVAIGPVATMKEWCEAHDATYQILSPPGKVLLPARPEYSRAYSYPTEAIVLASIPKGRWAPGWDFAFTSDGIVLSDSGYMPLHSCHNFWPHVHYQVLNLVAHHAPDEVIYIDEEVLLLSAPCDSNFGHWAIDFLTRLPARDVLGCHGLKFAVAAHAPKKFYETLRLFGVPEESVIRCRNEVTYQFRMLHIYRPGRSMPPHPEHVRFLREQFYKPAKAPTAGKRVYLDRISVGTRMLDNDAECKKLFANEGFTTVDLATMSIAAQREFLADAEILIGTLGTNMLALYFAPVSCTVIGIIDDPALDPLVAQTCAILGMPFQFFEAAAIGVSELHRHSRDVNFRVDCAALSHRIRSITSSRESRAVSESSGLL